MTNQSLQAERLTDEENGQPERPLRNGDSDFKSEPSLGEVGVVCCSVCDYVFEERRRAMDCEIVRRGKASEF